MGPLHSFLGRPFLCCKILVYSLLWDTKNGGEFQYEFLLSLFGFSKDSSEQRVTIATKADLLSIEWG